MDRFHSITSRASPACRLAPSRYADIDKTMSKGDAYENHIARIVESIQQSHRKLDNLGWGRSNKLQGACGCKHQVDVSFIDRDKEPPCLVIIECKNWDDRYPVELRQVKELKSTFDDLLAHDLALENGFAMLVYTGKIRKGAKIFADYYNINLQRVGEPPNFVFKYEDIILAGVSIVAKASIIAKGTVIRGSSDTTKLEGS
jgi:hypothetical protein